MPKSKKKHKNTSKGKISMRNTPLSKTDNCASKFKELKPSALMLLDTVLEKIQGLKKFSEFHLNVNEDDIYSRQTWSICTYFEAVISIISQFDTKLNQLDKDNVEISNIKKNVEKVQELMAKGKRLIQLEKYNEAIDLHTEALQIKLTRDSIIYEVLFDRAWTNSKIGNFCDAINDCTKILETNPTKTGALLLRAQCYDFLEQYEKCIQDYEFALCATDAKENIEIRLKLEKVITTMKHKMAEEKNNIGKSNCASHNYRLAEKNYSEAIELWPSNLLFYRNRCKCRFMLGEYKQSLEDSTYIVAKNSTDEIGHECMAKCCLVLGDYDGAEQAIKSLAENNYDKNKYNYLKDYCTKLSDCERRANDNFYRKNYLVAVSIADEALRCMPKNVGFKLFKAKCFLHLGAVKEIKRLENDDGLPNVEQHYIKAIRSYCEGDLLEALSYLDQGLTLDPHHSELNDMKRQLDQLNMKKIEGDEMYAAQKFHGAIEKYTEALDIDMPRNSFTCKLYYNRAKAQSKIGNFHDAIDDCTNALDIQLNDVDALLLRAECYEYLDEFSESFQDYTTLSRIDTIINNEQQCKMVVSKIQNLKVALNHENALKQKSNGDENYEKGNYPLALFCYHAAIILWPQNVLFYKDRIECFMKSKNYKAVIEDCQTAAKFDKTFFKDYGRLINCYLIIGDISGAEKAIQKCLEAGSNDDMVQEYREQLCDLKWVIGKVNTCYTKGDFQSALFHVDAALKIAYDSLDLKLLKGECLALLNRFEEANVIAVSCAQSDPSSAEAVYIRSLCLYQEDWEQGLRCLENVIRLDPDHRKAKAMISKIKKFQDKDKTASKLLEEENYREAITHINEALEISPINSNFSAKLLYNRAFASSKTGFFRDAIKDCTKAMKNSWAVSKCLRIRANCYMLMRKFQSAVSDYETLLKIENSNEIESKLQEAKQALQRSQSDNYYDILDIEKTASKADIKKAYRRLALIHHPDKHSDAPNDEKIEQQELCKKINVAHEVLSDPRKRDEYDRQCQNNNSY